MTEPTECSEATDLTGPTELGCVGALVRDARGHVYAQRRSPDRRLLPGIWDVVGGHVEAGETYEDALAREIEEETGWRLRRIEAVLADWRWEIGGVTRHELDYLVEVDGDLAAPRLEEGKHDRNAWVGPADLELMTAGRTDGDRRLRDVVARAVRTRLTARLRLEPVDPARAEDLWRMHQDPWIAQWYAGAPSREDAAGTAAAMAAGWERDGVGKWLAYDRASGDLVGRGGASRIDLEGRSVVEAGWAVVEAYRGRGFAAEIGRAALAFAFDELAVPEVVAFTEVHNAASRAVMERLGMRYEREIRLPGLVEGGSGVVEDAPFALYALRPGR